jgi:hypothetical protein
MTASRLALRKVKTCSTNAVCMLITFGLLQLLYTFAAVYTKQSTATLTKLEADKVHHSFSQALPTCLHCPLVGEAL